MAGIDSAYDQLRRMANRGEIKIGIYTAHGRKIPQLPRLIMHPKDTLSPQKWEHEIARGNCYAALHNTGKLTGYRSAWTKDEREEFAKAHGVYFDSQFELQGSKYTFFLEVDMGTEYWDNELNEKVEEYASLAQSMPQHPFYAVFVANSKDGTDRRERLAAFGKCFQKYGRGKNFVVTDLDLFIDDPLGKIFANEKLTAPSSLFDLP